MVSGAGLRGLRVRFRVLGFGLQFRLQLRKTVFLTYLRILLRSILGVQVVFGVHIFRKCQFRILSPDSYTVILQHKA